MKEMSSVQVEMMSRETIKPSSPTPPHLRTYKFSLMDQLSARHYVFRVLFYSTTSIHHSHRLKTSLSQTLAQYYPFAGRCSDEDQASIDCNDGGVDFLEARIHCPLSHLLRQPNPHTLRLVFPNELIGNNTYQGSLVVIQTSLFNCGGMAVAVCASHKLGDGCTLGAFLNHWAAVARQSEKQQLSPHFISLAHPSPASDQLAVPPVDIGRKSCVSRRFVFDGERIAELKAMARGTSGVENPTRVEVVTAILYKCVVAASRANSDSPTPSVLSQVVNMRPKMSPPLPETSAGNLSWHFTVSTSEEEDEREMSVQGLVAMLRKSKNQFFEKQAKNVSVSEWFMAISRLIEDVRKLYASNGNVNVYICSSMCNYPFYEVDFGWGRPVWMSIAGNMFNNTFCLVDSGRGDGIEAWVTLSEEDMAVFELDKDLLAFASLNPAIHVTYRCNL